MFFIVFSFHHPTNCTQSWYILYYNNYYWHFLPIFSQSGSSPAQRNSNEYNFGCRDDYDAADLELARLSYILAKCQSASHLKVPLNYTSPSPYSTPTTNTTTLTSATTIPAVASSTFQRLPSAFSLSCGGEAAHASTAALNQAPQSRKRRLPQAPQIGGWAAGMMLRSSKSEQNLVSSASAAFSDR